jgi:hypothetical protein
VALRPTIPASKCVLCHEMQGLPRRSETHRFRVTLPLPPSPFLTALQESDIWPLESTLHRPGLVSVKRPQDESRGAAPLWRLPLPPLAWLLFEPACETTLPCGQTPLSAGVVPPSCPLPHCRRPTQSVSAVLPSGPSRQDRTTAVNGPLTGSRAQGGVGFGVQSHSRSFCAHLPPAILRRRPTSQR